VALLAFICNASLQLRILFVTATEAAFLLSTQKTVMKTLYFLLVILFFINACDKPVEPDSQFTELTITQTTTPKTSTQGHGITSAIKVSGPDLCYRFAYFTVNQQQLYVDVHAFGTYPIKAAACAQAIYYKDTTLSIPTNTSGQYILRFYNNNQLFKADTVQVN
jgi:hypothetical protein